MIVTRRLTLAFASLLFVLAGAAADRASAVTYEVVDILGGTGNFGASLFHEASGCSAMCGSTILNFTNWDVTGTYDDSSGLLNLTATNTNDSAQYFTLSSTDPMLYAADGSLQQTASLDAEFSSAMLTAYAGSLADGTLTFEDNFVCCGSTPGADPNSFDSVNMVMALWGATGYVAGQGYVNPLYGLDLRIELSPVPLPAALPLLATALGALGFFGWRRRARA